MKALTHCHLYGIIDLGYIDAKDASRVAQSMVAGGVDVIQLRGKQQTVDELAMLAARLHEITTQAAVPLIANDYVEIARRVPVEGVHLGQDDEAVGLARENAGREIIVGKSTHSLEQAAAAQKEGADYIGFGPIFATPTKPDYAPIGLTNIQQVHRDVSIPIFCIGGITLENLGQVIHAGAERVVIVSGLLKARDIANYAEAAKQLLLAARPALNSQPSTLN